jgi:hypothetical protein
VVGSEVETLCHRQIRILDSLPRRSHGIEESCLHGLDKFGERMGSGSEIFGDESEIRHVIGDALSAHTGLKSKTITQNQRQALNTDSHLLYAH